MKHVSIIVYEDIVLSNVAGVFALLVAANSVCKRLQKEQLLNIELVSAQASDVRLCLPVTFSCPRTINDNFKTDLVVVPSMTDLANSIPEILRKNDRLIKWLVGKRAEGAELLSLCTGVYLLAEGGLLDGYEAATHWEAIDHLHATYPKIKFRSEKVTIDQKGIITGGGALTSFNAVLYVIEKFCGKDVAVEISKIYGIDYGRHSQRVFTIFNGQHHHHDDKIHAAQKYIEEYFTNELSVENIADEVSMSKRNFFRRFRAATGLNPIEYIQRIRMEAAKKYLEQGQVSIALIPEKVGYNDLKTFRSIFKKTTGYSPMAYKKIYNKD